MMDKGLLHLFILLGGTFVFVAVATAVYFVWYFHSIHKSLARINQLVLEKNDEDAYAEVLILWQHNPKVVDIGCLAVDVAYVAGRYAESIEHVETCQALLSDPQHVNTCYFENVLRITHPRWAEAQHPLRSWLNYALVRARFQRCYREYDYAGALACIDSYELFGDITPACSRAWRAYFHMLQGEYDQAREQLRLARQFDPKDKQYLSIQGHWHWIHGEQKEALEYYRQHQDWPSLEEDFHHIQQVFSLKTPELKQIGTSTA
ncbi:MAG TPA: hypothetical protein PKA06_08045 [Gemmatales bacterium]|nr:hypothetical protein [Gemmatales bacterium]